MAMKVSRIKIYPFDSGESNAHLKAYAEIVLGDYLLIKGFKVIQGKNGSLFVGFPSQKGKDGNYRDLVVPMTTEARNKICDEILEVFRNFY